MPGVKLSSLRVDATLDASGYESGARAKVAADKQMTDSAGQVGTAVQQTERSLASSSSGFERLRNVMDPATKAANDHAKALQTIQRAVDNGKITDPLTKQVLTGNAAWSEANRLIGLVNQRYAQGATSAGAYAAATENAHGASTRLMRELRSGAIEAANGNFSSFTGTVAILTQHFAELSIGTVALIGVVVGIPVAFAIAAERSEEALKRIQVALESTGYAAGVTIGQVEATANELAGNTSLSISGARTGLTGLVGTGRVPSSLLAPAAGLTPDLERATGSAGAAQKLLESVFADPAKAAHELEDRFNALSTAQVRQIEDLTRSGHVQEAERLVVEALSERFAGLDQRAMTPFEAAMNRATKAASDFWEKATKGRPQTLEERRAAAQATIAAGGYSQALSATTGETGISGFSTSTALDEAKKELAYTDEAIALQRLVAQQREQVAEQDRLASQGGAIADASETAAVATRKLTNESDLLALAIASEQQRYDDLYKLLSDAPENAEATLKQLKDAEDLLKRMREAQGGLAIAAGSQRSPADLAAMEISSRRTVLQASQRDRARAEGQAEIQRQYEADRTNPQLAGSADQLRQQRQSNLNLQLGQPTRDTLSNLTAEAKGQLDLASAYGMSTAAAEKQKVANDAHLAFLRGAITDEAAYRDALLRTASATEQAANAQRVAEGARRVQDLRGEAGAQSPAELEAAQIKASARQQTQREFDLAGDDPDKLKAAQQHLDLIIQQAQAEADLNRTINSNREDQQLEQTLEERQLELSLMGKNATLRAQELADLQLKNQLIREGFTGDDLDQEYEKRKQITEQIAATTVAITAQQNQQKLLNKDISTFVSQIGTDFERAATSGGTLHQRAQELLKDFETLIEKAFIWNPLQNALQSLATGKATPEGQGSSSGLGMGGGILGLLGVAGKSLLQLFGLGGTAGTGVGSVEPLTGFMSGGESSTAAFTDTSTFVDTGQALTFAGDIPAFARGGVIGRGGRVLKRFAGGGVVTDPTYFALQGGNLGVMGEAGTEGILPLTNVGGQLGVHAGGLGGGGDYYHVDARGATDPAAVKRAVQEGITAARPGIIREASGRAVISTFGQIRQGGTAAQVSGRRV